MGDCSFEPIVVDDDDYGWEMATLGAEIVTGSIFVALCE